MNINSQNISLKKIIYAGMLFISMIYSFFMIPNIYATTAKFSIESGSEKASLMPSWLPTSSNNKDAYLLMEYAKSATMLEKIKSKFSIPDEYFQEGLTPYGRILLPTGSYGVREAYRSFLKYNVDEISGVITISYEDTNPMMSKNILDYIIDESNVFINKISGDRLERESQRQEVIVAKYLTQLNELKQSLSSIKKKMGIESPNLELESSNGKIAQLEKVKLEKELEYEKKKAYLVIGSSDLESLSLEIEGIAKMIDVSKKSMVSGKLIKTELIKEYEELVSRVEITKAMWQKTLSESSMARESIRANQKTFVLIQDPILEIDPIGPNRFYNFLTIIITLMMIYFVGRFILETILDHKD